MASYAAEKKHCFQNFSAEQMKLSPRYDRSTISKANERYDTFIVGSDIVWGMDITGRDYSFFLDFVENEKKKYSFSSSIGTAWEEKDKHKIQRCLQRFDSISVREQLASEWIEELLGKKVPITCDPTMLWPMDFWKNMSENAYAPKEKYVLIYLTTKDKVNIRDGIVYAQKNGIKAYYIDFNHLKPVKDLNIVKPVSIHQWIALIANAEAVFSASYHGLLFSLYFHRNVFYYNRGNTSRMISLCKELNIENREGKDEFLAADAPIDYEFVDQVLTRKRADSWNYLKTILE